MLSLHDYTIGYYHQITGNHEEFVVTAVNPASAISAAFNYMQNARFLDHGMFHISKISPPSKDIPS